MYLSKDLADLEIKIKVRLKNKSTRGHDAVKTALNVESIAERFRRRPWPRLPVQRPAYEGDGWGSAAIQVAVEKNNLRLVFPGILPKKKEGRAVELGRAVTTALERAGKDAALRKFDWAALCFIHVYPPGTPYTAVRDYDNVETRPVLDVLSSFILEERGSFGIVHHCMKFGKHSHTEVLVMPAADFVNWTKGEENDSVSD